MTEQIAFSAFESITEAWLLTDQERAALLDTDLTTFRKWRRLPEQVHLAAEQVRRVSYVLNIYDATHRIFGDAEYANDWIHRANAGLGDRVPLNVMLQDLDGLASIHEHLQCIAAND